MKYLRLMMTGVAAVLAGFAGAQTTITGSGGTVTTEPSLKLTLGASPGVLHVFNASNVELLRLQPNGFLGIGTAVPNRKLDVSASSDGITFGTHADNIQAIQTYIDGHWADRATYAGGCCNGLLLQPDGGYVAIGTTTPVGVYKLEVAGQIYASAGGYRFPDNTVQTTAATTTWTRTGAGDEFTLSTTDKLGIGTPTPNGTLDVHNAGDGIVIGKHADNVLSIQSYIDGQWSTRSTYAGGCCNTLLLAPDAGNIGMATSAPTVRVEIGTMFPVQFVDLATQGVPNGYRLNLWSNGDIRVAGLQLGQTGLPIIQSTGTVYLNPSSGTVAIGTMQPDVANKLHVAGDAYFSGTVKGTLIQANYQDLAEWVPATNDFPPGTVVTLNPQRVNEVMASQVPYDARVAGVVSAQPGLLLGEAGHAKEMVATTGRVKVRVHATAHSIAIGDLLVTSDKTGMAMKSVPMQMNGRSFHQPGTIIGKALEPLPSGDGEILVLLSLQ